MILATYSVGRDLNDVHTFQLCISLLVFTGSQCYI